MIEADGREVGIVPWQHPTRDEFDLAGLVELASGPILAIDSHAQSIERPKEAACPHRRASSGD
jgi:hypothetical protein